MRSSPLLLLLDLQTWQLGVFLFIHNLSQVCVHTGLLLLFPHSFFVYDGLGDKHLFVQAPAAKDPRSQPVSGRCPPRLCCHPSKSERLDGVQDTAGLERSGLDKPPPPPGRGCFLRGPRDSLASWAKWETTPSIQLAVAHRGLSVFHGNSGANIYGKKEFTSFWGKLLGSGFGRAILAREES